MAKAAPDSKMKKTEGKTEGQKRSWPVMFWSLCTKSTIVYWILLTPCIALGIQYNSFFLFLISYNFLFFMTEYIYYFKGFAIFDPEIVIYLYYTTQSMCFEVGRNPGFDLGFNLYDGDYTKTPHQAQQDKFEYAWKKLGLKKGMSVCDVGCGNGDWLVWLKKKGVHATGINLCESQVQECQARGADVTHCNWKDVEHDAKLREKFFGKYDVVTLWDTIEHYVSCKDSNNLEKCDAIYGSIFTMCIRMFKPDSKCKRVWSSTLHSRHHFADGGHQQAITELRPYPLRLLKYCIRHPTCFSYIWNIYLLDRIYSGSYPSDERQTLDLNAKRHNFELTYAKDRTYDYMKTSLLNPEHFGHGNSSPFTPDRVFVMLSLIVTSPFWWHTCINHFRAHWLNHFGGLGSDLEKNWEKNSFVRLWWHMWELKPASGAKSQT